MTINKQTKIAIMEAAREYMTHKGLSQDGFVDHIKKMNGGMGVSVAYLNDMLKLKFVTGRKQTPITDKYFHRIAKGISFTVRKTFRMHHDTDNYLQCMNTFSDARDSKMPHAIDGRTGDGKSYTASEYAKQYPKNTYIVRCDGDLTAKSFFMEMAYSLGITPNGPIYNIRKNVIAKLKNDDDSLLIIDEAENLKDRAWESMKRVMDDLKGYCGIVFIGANELELMMQKKSDKLKGCFPQVLRRIREGGFVQLFQLSMDDVSSVCKPYKITKRDHIKQLFDTCRNMGELTAMIEKISREADQSKRDLDELIDLYCQMNKKPVRV